jgi:hypothetical protein
MTSDQPLGVRAGFWRRCFSFLIDLIVILVPFQLIVAYLFVATSGHIQLVNFAWCSELLETVPDGLVPQPPAGFNLVRDCNENFFGVQTGRYLIVGRYTEERKITDNITFKDDVSQIYTLDRDGHPVDGLSIGWWIMMLALIAYLVAMETRTGTTLGSRAMRIRVIEATTPTGPNIPLCKIVSRYLVLLIGVLPFLADIYFGSVINELAGSSFTSVAVAVLFGWIIFLSVQMARKRDPLYDKIAGTAVVRASAATAIGGS